MKTTQRPFLILLFLTLNSFTLASCGLPSSDLQNANGAQESTPFYSGQKTFEGFRGVTLPPEIRASHEELVDPETRRQREQSDRGEGIYCEFDSARTPLLFKETKLKIDLDHQKMTFDFSIAHKGRPYEKMQLIGTFDKKEVPWTSDLLPSDPQILSQRRIQAVLVCLNAYICDRMAVNVYYKVDKRVFCRQLQTGVVDPRPATSGDHGEEEGHTYQPPESVQRLFRRGQNNSDKFPSPLEEESGEITINIPNPVEPNVERENWLQLPVATQTSGFWVDPAEEKREEEREKERQKQRQVGLRRANSDSLLQKPATTLSPRSAPVVPAAPSDRNPVQPSSKSPLEAPPKSVASTRVQPQTPIIPSQPVVTADDIRLLSRTVLEYSSNVHVRNPKSDLSGAIGELPVSSRSQVPPKTQVSAPLTAAPLQQAIGSHMRGFLKQATYMPLKGKGFVRTAYLKDPDITPETDQTSAWGTDRTRDFIEKVGALVDAHFPGLKLTVSSVARKNGGRRLGVDGGVSHQNGLDVDFRYVRKNQDDRPFDAVEGHRISSEFDLEKNWAVAKSVVQAQPEWLIIIFMDFRIKKAFCELAQSRGEDLTNKESLAYKTLSSILHEPGHDDHFHVRLLCPGTEGCVNSRVSRPIGTGCPR